MGYRWLMRRVGLGVIIACACGGGDGGGTPDAPPAADADALITACAVISACMGGDPGLHACVVELGPFMTAAKVTCLEAATAADCPAVAACLGYSISIDPSCVEGCADADTIVQCDGSVKAEYECASYIQSSGPACVTGSRQDCGGATCTIDGEVTCDGSVVSRCDSGITEVFDCGRWGLECVPGDDCRGPAAGACTAGTPDRCDGDGLVECVADVGRRMDCAQLVPGMTCVDALGVATCGFGEDCDPASATSTTCTGTMLTACVAGAAKTIDCLAIGATSCVTAGVDSHCRP